MIYNAQRTPDALVVGRDEFAGHNTLGRPHADQERMKALYDIARYSWRLVVERNLKELEYNA